MGFLDKNCKKDLKNRKKKITSEFDIFELV